MAKPRQSRSAATEPARLRKGERTRLEIQVAVIELANEMRPDSIKVGDICERAGIPTGSFYFHFRSREDALESSAAAELQTFYQELLAVPHADDLLTEIEAILQVFDRYRRERPRQLNAVFAILATHRPVRAAWLDLRGILVGRLADRFARERPRRPGAFASDHVLAHFLLGGVERFYDDVFVGPPDPALHREAGSTTVFVREQARLWHRAVVGVDPENRT
jgi:AcrR family transcriptional regulator